MTEQQIAAEDIVPDFPYYVALVIDDTIVSIYNCTAEHAAQYMSQPKFVQVEGNANLGWIYKDGVFVSPKEQ